MDLKQENRRITFNKEFEEKLNLYFETSKVMKFAAESSLNTMDIDRDLLVRNGLTHKEIDQLNNEKLRVMDKMKKYFSSYFLFGIVYCSIHSFKFYRLKLPLRKSVYPLIFMISTFYIAVLYSMRSFNYFVSDRIDKILFNKYFIEDASKKSPTEIENEKILIKRKIEFNKFMDEKLDFLLKYKS